MLPPCVWIIVVPFSLLSQKILQIVELCSRLHPVSSTFIGSWFLHVSNTRFCFLSSKFSLIFSCQISFILTLLPVPSPRCSSLQTWTSRFKLDFGLWSCLSPKPVLLLVMVLLMGRLGEMLIAWFDVNKGLKCCAHLQYRCSYSPV